MRKGLLCLLLFGSLGTALFGQDIPALEQAVQETSGLEQFKTLIALSDAYFGSGDFQKSLALKSGNGLKCGTIRFVTVPTREAVSKVQQVALILSPGFQGARLSSVNR